MDCVGKGFAKMGKMDWLVVPLEAEVVDEDLLCGGTARDFRAKVGEEPGC
jgi:hypothetical protein